MLQGNFNAKTDLPETLPNQSHLQSHPMESLKEQVENATSLKQDVEDKNTPVDEKGAPIPEEQLKEQPE